MIGIKTKLIHWLGGVTKKESDANAAMARLSGVLKGEKKALQTTLDVMNEMYGNPKWGQIVYNFVKCYLEEISKA